MPGWMQAVVEVNPITHLATVVRGLMDGSVPAGEIGWVLVSSVLLVAVFGPIRPTRPTPSPVPGPDTTRRDA
jgi:ABC-2 type transport system permease protein